MKVKRYFLNSKNFKLDNSLLCLGYNLVTSFNDEASAIKAAEEIEKRTGEYFEVYVMEIDMYSFYKDV